MIGPLAVLGIVAGALLIDMAVTFLWGRWKARNRAEFEDLGRDRL